jgi:hypothetical protein
VDERVAGVFEDPVIGVVDDGVQPHDAAGAQLRPVPARLERANVVDVVLARQCEAVVLADGSGRQVESPWPCWRDQSRCAARD